MERTDASQVRANRLGIATMVGAMLCFIVNDALVKYASQSLPAAQLIFIRSLMASALVLAAATAMGATARIREIARGWVAIRAVVDAIATLLYLVSLFHLPIGTATAINMTSPLIITLLAALVLGERVGVALGLATTIGFGGVLLIVQPAAGGFNGYAFVCFLSAVLLSARDLITRRVHAAVPSILVTLSTTIAVTILAGALSLVQGWGPIGVADLGLLAIAAVMLTIAYVLIVNSTRYGDLSLVAPFRYTALLFAAALGYIVWGDTPNLLAWCGITLVIGAGIYVLRASRRSRTTVPTID